MPFYEMLPGGGMPAGLQAGMDSVLNKKWETSTTYPPEDWPGTVELMGPLEEKTVSGSIIAFPDGADDVPLKSCAVTIAPTLSGVSSVNVLSAGKNLIDFSQFAIAQTNYLWGYRNVGFPLKKGVTYTFSCSDAVSSLRFVSVDEQTVYAQNAGGATDHLTYTPTDDVLVVFRLWSSGINVSWVQLEVGSTATTYTQFVTPTTQTASLGRTIYGGTADIVNGTGSDVYTFDIWDGTQNYNVSDNLTNVFRFYLAHEKPLPNPTAVQCICDGYTFPRAGWSSDTVSFYSDANNFTLKLPKSEVTTIEQAKAWLAQHNVTFLYATTPETFTFTPTPIISRLGDNTLWGDGDLSVVYRSSGTQTLIQPTLISKTITANDTYIAEDDNADGYSEVIVNVSGGSQNIETVLSENPLIEITGVSGTDAERTMWTYTASTSGTIKFHADTAVRTNTGNNDGYFTVLKNNSEILSTYATTNTTTAFPVPDIDFENGDVITIVCGFDNYHTSAWFRLYSTILILTDS